MRKLSEKELLSINGGKKHNHWYCDVNGFLSTGYSSFEAAGKAADKHVAKYPSHSKKTWVKYCENRNHAII